MPPVHLPVVDLLTRARFLPLTSVFVVLATGWYLWARRTVRRGGRHWSDARTAAFLAGQVAYAVALLSGLHAFAVANFSAYGTQYILAALVAPMLWAFGAPLQLLVHSSTSRGKDRLFALIDSRPSRVATNGLVTWIVFVAATIVLFFSALLRDTVRGPYVEDLVFLGVAAAAFLFYWPVVDADPLPRRLSTWPRIAYLLLTFPVWAIVGMGIESETYHLVPTMSLGSLHLGAAVVWVAGETVAILGAVWVLWEWLRRDLAAHQAHERQNDAAAARQLALWRASRDAAARAS